jgi:RimJ/RimL family protein N-acetyltransferase
MSAPVEGSVALEPSPDLDSPGLSPMRICELRDGTKVCLRSIGPEDREEFLLGFEHLSPQSRYLRFFAPLLEMPARLVDQLLDTDDHRHIAIAAERFGPGDRLPGFLGVARLIRDANEPACADIAVAVIDEFQRRGLGRCLLDELSRSGQRLGLRRFRADILPENHAAKELLRGVGFKRPCHGADGALIYEIPPPPSRALG